MSVAATVDKISQLTSLLLRSKSSGTDFFILNTDRLFEKMLEIFHPAVGEDDRAKKLNLKK